MVRSRIGLLLGVLVVIRSKRESIISVSEYYKRRRLGELAASVSAFALGSSCCDLRSFNDFLDSKLKWDLLG